jgi:regulator of replication initiation timing
MEIKNVFKENDFVDLMQNVSNMKIDIFETITNERAFGISRSKFRISYDKVIKNETMYDDCYNAYKQSIKSLNNLYSVYQSEYVTIDEFVEALFEKLKMFVVVNNVLPSNNNDAKRKLTTVETSYYDAKKQDYISIILSHAHPDLNVLSAIKVLENSSAESVANFIDFVETNVDKILTESGADKTDVTLKDLMLREYLVIYLPESFVEGDNLTTQKIDINKTRFSGSDVKYKTVYHGFCSLMNLQG